MANWAVLNWKEILLLVESIRPEVEGLFVDRIVVPEKERFPGGYLKGEWAIRLTGRHTEGVFFFSVRTQRPYFYYLEGKGPKAAALGTRSAFDLELSKHLKGQKIVRLRAVDRERMILLECGELVLAISLIPASPEALLLRRDGDRFRIVTRSRIGKSEPGSIFEFPDGSKAPESPPVRLEWTRNARRMIEQALESEAFETRLAAAQRELKSAIKQANDRIRQTETGLREAERDQDWQRFGDLLKATLHAPPPLVADGKKWVREVLDFDGETRVRIPGDPKLSASQQVEKYYQLSRRKSRRITEGSSRVEDLSSARAKLSALLERTITPGDWKSLELLERSAHPLAPTGSPETARGKKTGAWLGKVFSSRDGLSILVGKSKDENLELTFKHSRGNDIWMHIRGRPGAHVLIPLQPGKSAPLETLLDAAVLCVYYSGGEKWGKTEVDYTFKKYVKRIKDSSEASYTNNKTLIVEPEAKRLNRLLNRSS